MAATRAIMPNIELPSLTASPLKAGIGELPFEVVGAGLAVVADAVINGGIAGGVTE